MITRTCDPIGRMTVALSWDPEARRVVGQVTAACGAADLGELLGEVTARIGDGLLRVEPTGQAGGQVTAQIRLQPYAELTLREVTAIARSTMDGATKGRRVQQILALGGY